MVGVISSFQLLAEIPCNADAPMDLKNELKNDLQSELKNELTNELASELKNGLNSIVSIFKFNPSPRLSSTII